MPFDTSQFINPLPGHCFDIDFGGLTLLNRVVRSCDLSLTDQQVVIEFYESDCGSVLPLLISMIAKDVGFITRLRLKARNGNNFVGDFFLHGMKLIDHKLSLTHIDARALGGHRVVFSFEDIIPS